MKKYSSFRRVSAEELLEFIKKNPGLAASQMNERFGHNVSSTVEKLCQDGKVRWIKGLNALTYKTCRIYFPVENENETV